jgi:hypothetical protein
MTMPNEREANYFVHMYGKALIGRYINTPANGDYPGGVATVRRLGDDPNAPDIVLIVHRPGYELDEIGIFGYEQISFAYMSDLASRQHFEQLVRIYEEDKKVWEESLKKLSKQERFLVVYGDHVEGFPPHPRDPKHVKPHEQPHPHLVNEASREGIVWVGNHGWMHRQEWEDILQWSREEHGTDTQEEGNEEKQTNGDH